MKIDRGTMVKLSGNRSLQRILGTMKEGARMPARIVERLDSRQAIIDIGGKKIRAEFIKGLPGSNHITLILDEKKNDTYFFRILSSGGRDGHMESLKEFLITATTGNFTASSFLNLTRYLNSSPAGLFEMNLFLLNPHRENRIRGEGITRLIHTLQSMGVRGESLQTLSFVLLSLKMDLSVLLPFFKMTRREHKNENIPFFISNDEAEIENSLNEIIDKVESIDDSTIRESFIALVGELYGPHDNEAETCELPLPCGDDIIPLRFAGSDESWIITADFSRLGKVEILVHKDRGSIHIILIADSPEACQELREMEGDLKGTLPDAAIKIYVKQSVFDKLVEINSYYAVNSQFDIKL